MYNILSIHSLYLRLRFRSFRHYIYTLSIITKLYTLSLHDALPIFDFWRDRRMLCGGCGHCCVVDLDWIDRWEQAKETCPGCGLTCEHEDAPRVTVDAGDPALNDDLVAQFFWYHTSTQPDWPSR